MEAHMAMMVGGVIGGAIGGAVGAIGSLATSLTPHGKDRATEVWPERLYEHTSREFFIWKESAITLRGLKKS
jgi:hypothetical protein